MGILRGVPVTIYEVRKRETLIDSTPRTKWFLCWNGYALFVQIRVQVGQWTVQHFIFRHEDRPTFFSSVYLVITPTKVREMTKIWNKKSLGLNKLSFDQVRFFIVLNYLSQSCKISSRKSLGNNKRIEKIVIAKYLKWLQKQIWNSL